MYSCWTYNTTHVITIVRDVILRTYRSKTQYFRNVPSPRRPVFLFHFTNRPLKTKSARHAVWVTDTCFRRRDHRNTHAREVRRVRTSRETRLRVAFARERRALTRRTYYVKFHTDTQQRKRTKYTVHKYDIMYTACTSRVRSTSRGVALRPSRTRAYRF